MLHSMGMALARARCRLADWLMAEYRFADPGLDEVLEGPDQSGHDPQPARSSRLSGEPPRKWLGSASAVDGYGMNAR